MYQVFQTRTPVKGQENHQLRWIAVECDAESKYIAKVLIMESYHERPENILFIGQFVTEMNIMRIFPLFCEYRVVANNMFKKFVKENKFDF